MNQTRKLLTGFMLISTVLGFGQTDGMFNNISVLRDYTSHRSSSYDRSGQNHDYQTINAGSILVLLEERNAGCIKHIYWTYISHVESERMNIFRGLVLRMFWDGSDIPSVEVPLGDFFGISNGLIRPVESLAFTVNYGFNLPHRSWGFNCYLPMPFAEGARIELENQGDKVVNIWFHIDYELYENASALPEGTGRLHAHWNRIIPDKIAPAPMDWEAGNLTGDENYLILDAKGDGQFAGYFLTVVNHERGWWGEGDDMIFIDGESFPPSIHGTGSEEVFGGGACPDKEYSGPYTGFHCIENRQGYQWWGTNGMYRFYLTDPIRFRKSIRVTIEQGHNNVKAGFNDYCSTAFWYQRGVNASYQPLAPVSERKFNFK
jgi:hypothetical protein